MIMIKLTVVFLISIVSNALASTKNIDVENILNDAASDSDELSSKEFKNVMKEKTKLLDYEYVFESRTLISEKGSGLNETFVRTLNATIAFQILHHDLQGKILARFRLLQCVSGDCQYEMPDLLVDFIQGGNNLRGLYIVTSGNNSSSASKPTWNILFSIVQSLTTPAVSGAGDEQNVLTSYGWCHYRFTKPRDKIFTRRINHCDFDGIRNYSLIPHITQQKYEQNMLYVQNTKVNADIVQIEGDEKLLISSPVHAHWTMLVQTNMKMEMTNRTELFVKRKCLSDALAGECAERVFKAKKLGKNWKEISQSVTIGIRKRRSKVAEVLERCNTVLEKEKKQDGMIVPLFNSVLFSTEVELVEAIQQFQNATVMPIFVEALGLSGVSSAHQAVRKALDSIYLLCRYLQALALTTKINPEIITDLRSWLNESVDDPAIHTQLAFTVANLYRRHCLTSKSTQSLCENGQVPEINSFITTLTDCAEIDCHLRALQILQNLPLPSLIPYAAQFLCTSANATKISQFSALKLFKLFDLQFLSKEVMLKMLKIFDNACPLPQTTSDQIVATEILLDAALKYPFVATFMLKSESISPQSHEKWAYFYKSLSQRRSANPKVDAFWKQMRAFRVFRPNYGHRSLLAASGVVGFQIAAFDGNAVSALVRSELNEGILKWTDFSIDLSRPQSHTSIMQARVETNGLESYLHEGSSTEAEEAEEGASSPRAEAQLGIAGNRMPPIVLFDGYSDLLSVLWNANGEPTTFFDTNLIVRQYYGYIPLLSGFSMTLDMLATVGVDLIGSATISMWNRDASLSIDTNLSGSLEASVQLASPNGLIGRISTVLSTQTTISTEFDADFYTKPHLLCIIVSESPTEIRHSYTRTVSAGNRSQRVWHKRTLPARCFSLSQQISEQCAALLTHRS